MISVSSVDGAIVQFLVLFLGCLVAAVHGWIVGAFVCAMLCVLLGDCVLRGTRGDQNNVAFSV